MARARLLECMVENTKLEEGIEDPAWIAHLALNAASEAVDLSLHTENRRLQARALIWQGLTLCNTSGGSAGSAVGYLDGARDICDRAAALLKNEVQDHIWEDLQVLKTRVVSGGNPDARLQAGSQGVVGDRSFQQLTEDFADLVIPKVWEHEGAVKSRAGRAPVGDLSEEGAPGPGTFGPARRSVGCRALYLLFSRIHPWPRATNNRFCLR